MRTRLGDQTWDSFGRLTEAFHPFNKPFFHGFSFSSPNTICCTTAAIFSSVIPIPLPSFSFLFYSWDSLPCNLGCFRLFFFPLAISNDQQYIMCIQLNGLERVIEFLFLNLLELSYSWRCSFSWSFFSCMIFRDVLHWIHLIMI